MESEPKVSIIMPFRDGAEYVRETLECLKKQIYRNWECIMVDDGSTDNSAEIIKPMMAEDDRLHYIYQQNAGAASARNNGIRNSSGKYILPLDVDDLISDQYVKIAVSVLENNPEIKVVTCRTEMFGAKKGEFKLPDFSFDRLIIKNMIVNSSIYRRSDYDNTGGYDTAMFGSEDWEFWISMLKTGGDVYRIPDFHFFYRRHSQSKNKKYHCRREELRRYVCKKHKELYVDLFDNPIQTYIDLNLYKKYYNIYRTLTFQKRVK